MGNRWGNSVNSVRLYFFGLQNHSRWWLQPWNEKTFTPWKEVMTNIDSILKSRDVTLSAKVHLVKTMVFPIVMYGCKRWTLKKAESWGIDAFELRCWRRLEISLDCKEIQPVHCEGYQPWDFFGRNDAKAETPVLWPPDWKSWFIQKDPDSGKDWWQKKKGTREDEMVGWLH